MTPRAAIYTRISSDDRRDELGVKRQEKRCREYVDAEGWELAGVYCDNNRSASSERAQRPEFLRLVADLEAGAVDRVVVLKQDRLVRKPDELEPLMRTLRTVGCDVIDTVTDGPVNVATTTGRTMARVKGVFDIAYAEFISEKVREKKDELAEHGLPSGGGTRPFGYEADKVTVREAEAEALVDAAARILAGESLNSIAREWNEHGPATVTGARWQANVLRNVLASPRVAGLRQHRGEVVGEAAWPAILDRDTWESVRAILEDPNRRHKPREGRHLLTRILRCQRCGAGLVAGVNNGNRAYLCRKSHGGCGRLAIRAEETEAVVVEMVLASTEGPALRQALTADRAAASAEGLEAVERRLAELAEVYASGDITMAEWMTARRSLEVQRIETRDALEATARSRQIEPLLQGSLRRRWHTLPPETQRAVVGYVLDYVEVAPAVRGKNSFDIDRLRPVWRH